MSLGAYQPGIVVSCRARAPKKLHAHVRRDLRVLDEECPFPLEVHEHGGAWMSLQGLCTVQCFDQQRVIAAEVIDMPGHRRIEPTFASDVAREQVQIQCQQVPGVGLNDRPIERTKDHIGTPAVSLHPLDETTSAQQTVSIVADDDQADVVRGGPVDFVLLRLLTFLFHRLGIAIETVCEPGTIEHREVEPRFQIRETGRDQTAKLDSRALPDRRITIGRNETVHHLGFRVVAPGADDDDVQVFGDRGQRSRGRSYATRHIGLTFRLDQVPRMDVVMGVMAFSKGGFPDEPGAVDDEITDDEHSSFAHLPRSA